MNPTKGDRTRQRILDRVGPVFNARGYHATTLADVMAATGLEKGGIYNHFRSKDELALAAYDRNADLQGELIAQRVRAAADAPDKLVAVIEAFRAFAHDPPFPGGCPTLNTAVEACHVDPQLHERAQAQMARLLELVAALVRRGVERGELQAGVDADATASLVASSVEGALLLHQLFGDAAHVDRVCDHLERHVRSLAKDPA
ncbi:MAG TPA: TetR/AcrR family transcriptional regulator [Acidimicrobiales bacterium]|nr:TetR/AcrR family transcriptional regulator [Acidimicrobiales bacterium]